MVGLALTGGARGQDTLTLDYGPGSWLIGSDEVRAITEIVGLTSEQNAAARELLRGAKAELQIQDRRVQRAMMPLYSTMWIQGDAGAKARKQMETHQLAFAESCEKVEKQFFADVMSLLEADQLAKWPTFERARRRTLLAWTGASSQSDLSMLVRGMELTPEEKSTLAPMLERYETELDALILERRGVMRQNRVWMSHRMEQDDPKKFEAVQTQLNEIDGRIGSLQRTHAQILGGRLGGERGQILMATASTAPQYFSTLDQQHQFRELLRLRGVTDEQRTKIRKLLTAGEAEFRRQTSDFFTLTEKQQKGEPVNDEEFQAKYQAAQLQFASVCDKYWKLAFEQLTDAQRRGYTDGTDPATEGEDDREMRGHRWWK